MSELSPESIDFMEGIIRGDKEDAPPLGDTTEAQEILEAVAPVEGEVGGRRRKSRRARRMRGGCCGSGANWWGGGGRRKRSRTRRIVRRGRRRSHRWMRGGAQCFGTGYGATSYDPNFSIYNTRELQLFPYKPN